MDIIDDAIATAEREWRAYGIRREDRAALAADLRLELESAAADGVTPEQLFGTDLRSFARRLADESGMRHTDREDGRLVRTALAGAALGTGIWVIALVFGYPLLFSWFDIPQQSARMPFLYPALLYFGPAAALVAVGAVIAVRIRLTDLPKIRHTANAMIVMLPITGVIITPIMVGFAAIFNYSNTTFVVAVEAALAAAAVASAALVARRWSIRDHRHHVEVLPA